MDASEHIGTGDDGSKDLRVQKCEVEDYYEIFEQVGKGRFGVVHRCVEKATGKTWAAKCIRAIRRKDRDEINREVELMSVLEHPMLLQCGGAFEGRSKMTIILEFVSGGELFERIISDDFEFCESDAVIFMRQICLGVKYMHKQNIVHLDLKPENVMCVDTRSNRIKLIDFGLARKLLPGDSLKVMFGTPEFVAPEVINYDPIDTATDMWSVGVICYILLSGLSPFLGDSDVDTLNNVTGADWDFDDPAFDTVSEEAKVFIEALLVKLSRKRHSAIQCLEHVWLAGDTRPRETNRLCTAKLKRYVAKRRWQKTAIALRAIHRMNVLMMFASKSSDTETKSSVTPTASQLTKVSSSTHERSLNTTTSDSATGPRLKRKNSIVDQVRQKFELNNNNNIQGCDVFNIGKEKTFAQDKPRNMAVAMQTSLKYQSAPILLDTLKDCNVCQRGRVRFDCKVKGDPIPDISWFKDGNLIEEDYRFKIEFDNICRYSLLISDVGDDDFGQYAIEAKNNLGECKSSAVLREEKLSKDTGEGCAEEEQLSSQEFSPDKNQSLTEDSTKAGHFTSITLKIHDIPSAVDQQTTPCKYKWTSTEKTTSVKSSSISPNRSTVSRNQSTPPSPRKTITYKEQPTTQPTDNHQSNLAKSTSRGKSLSKSDRLSGSDITNRVFSTEASTKSPPSTATARNIVTPSTKKSLVSHWKESTAKSKTTRTQVPGSRIPGKLSTNIVQRFSTPETKNKATNTQDIPLKRQASEKASNLPRKSVISQVKPDEIVVLKGIKTTSIKSPSVSPNRSTVPRNQSTTPSPRETITNKQQTITQHSRSRSSSIKSPSQRLSCGQVGEISSKLEKPNKDTTAQKVQRKTIKTNKDISELSKRFSSAETFKDDKGAGYLKTQEKNKTVTPNSTPNRTQPVNKSKVGVESGKTRIQSPRSGLAKSTRVINKEGHPVSRSTSSNESSTNLTKSPKKEDEAHLIDTLKSKKTGTQVKGIPEPKFSLSPKSSIAYATQKLQEPNKMARRTVTSIDLSSGRTKGIGALAAKFETKSKTETTPTISTKSRNEPSFASRFQEKNNDDINRNGKGKDVGNCHSPVKRPIKPPAFGVKPKRESSRAGGKASFHCTAFGMSKPDVTWIFDGKVLENSNRHKIHIDKGIYYLQIIDLILEDAGIYICKMENTAGSVEVPVELTVRDNQTRREFQNGLTTTSASTTNSNSSSISTSHKLNAFKKFNDLCKTNGQPSRPTSNGVQKSAEPVKPVETATKKETTSIKLSSTVKQSDEPNTTKLQTKTFKFELKKAQTSAKPKANDSVDSSSLSSFSSSTTTLVDVKVESTTPKRSSLSVTPKIHQPPQFTSRPKSQAIKESKSAKFTCSVTGDPTPDVKWMKDGEAVPSEPRFKILDTEGQHTLEIDDVVKSDAGRYSCVLTSPAGKATASSQLTVQAIPSLSPKIEAQFPPKFLRKLSNLKCKDAESVSFECRVSGTPKPKISWFFEGKPITEDDVYQLSFDGLVAKLTIVEVFPEDTGNYTCTLTNSAGTTSSTAKLEVEDGIEINGGASNGSRSNSVNLTIIPEKISTPQVKVTSTPTKSSTSTPVTTAPEFVKKLTDVTVDDGSPLTLRVEVKGSPSPTAMWLFEDEEVKEEEDFKLVSDGNTHSLVIAEVYPDDGGAYTCVITNSAGKTSTSCKVLVNESGDVGVPPQFLQRPHQMNIDEGTVITLTCKVDGDPEPNVFWSKDGRIIQPSDRVQLLSEGFSHSLRIPAAIVTDTGSYTCIAKNEAGEEKCTVSIMVHQIEEEHTDFRALLKSRPMLQKMDSINQNEEEKETEQLDFRHVLNKSKSEEEEEPQTPTKDAVQAEQLDFRHLLTRHVQTKQHPKFTKDLSDVVVDEGSSAVLVCDVIGTPSPTIIWKFKGKEIKESKYFRMTYEGNVAKLSISETFAEDEGEYICLASNSAGSTRSVADLRVKACDSEEPEYVSNTSTETTATTKPNDEVDSTFHSPISAKVKPPVVNAVGQKVASFTMNASAKPFGETSSKMPNVSPPEFIEELCDEPIIEGSAARLECRLIGDPEPVVYWYKDGKELKEGRKYSFEFDDDDIVALVIKETTMRDLGKYACKAVNSLGTVECSAQLIIEAPPKVEKYPRNLIVSAGKDIEITCRISGTPEPDIEWNRGRKEIVEGGRIEIEDVDDDTMLFIRNAKQEDSGIYKLILNNDLGTDSCTISVSVVDKPDPPTGKPVASNVSRTSLTLSWSGSPYDGGSIITGYVVEMCKGQEENWSRLTKAKSTSYVVRGLVPESMYAFRVRSENDYGVSDPGLMSDPVRTTETKVEKETNETDSGDEGDCPFESRHVVVKSGDIKTYYDIQEQVGKGRFGIVHKCMEKSTGKMWAAKFIKTKASEKEAVKAEIDIMNQLKHPKLIQCVDAFETAREIIMVLEFVRGGELFERVIDDDFILTEKDVIMFMRQICSGVKHMHSQNILHLDLKPENILCTDTTGNTIKLIDFGLARKFDPKQAVKVMFGTPEFVAPEVVNYEQIGYKTDMWSVGVICYILLSGLSPFMGDNDAETLSAVTMAEWDFEDESFDEISDEAKDFIEQLLLKTKDKRMSADDGLEHMWLTKDTQTMKTTKISTDKLKKFVARRRWQKTANAVRAIARMASLSMFGTRNRSSSQDDASGGITPFSSILKSKREEVKNTNNNVNKSNDTEVDINLNDTSTTKISSSSRRNRKSTEEKNAPVDKDESPSQNRSSSGVFVKRLSTDSFSRFETKTSKSLSSATDVESIQKNEPSNQASGEQKVWPPSGQRGTKDGVKKEAKPKFLKKIRSATVLEGQQAQFDCIVIGDPTPEVSWYQDGLELPENGRYSVTNSNNGSCSLRITNVIEDDDAEYTVKAINASGNIACSAELVVDLK